MSDKQKGHSILFTFTLKYAINFNLTLHYRQTFKKMKDVGHTYYTGEN